MTIPTSQPTAAAAGQTPRCDAAFGHHTFDNRITQGVADFARTLERELATAKAEVAKIQSKASREVNEAQAQTLDLRATLRQPPAPGASAAVRERALQEALEIAINTVECDSLDKDGNPLPWYRAAKKALALAPTAPAPEVAELRAEVEKQRLDYGQLNGRLGLCAAKWFLIDDNLPTDETFKQMEIEIIATAQKYLELVGENESLCAELAQLRAACEVKDAALGRIRLLCSSDYDERDPFCAIAPICMAALTTAPASGEPGDSAMIDWLESGGHAFGTKWVGSAHARYVGSDKSFDAPTVRQAIRAAMTAQRATGGGK